MRIFGLLAACLIPFSPFSLRTMDSHRPHLADKVPAGFKEVGRFDLHGHHHVIFSYGENWRWYVDGKLDTVNGVSVKGRTK